MEFLNLSNIDRSCHKALTLMLRPRYYPAIEPWVLTASVCDKKLLLEICENAFTDFTSHSVPVIPNDNGLTVPYNANTQSIDLMQIPHISTAPERVAGIPTTTLEFRDQTKVVKAGTGGLAEELYVLKFKRLSQEECMSIMLPKVSKNLEIWQVYVHSKGQDHTPALRLLRSILNCWKKFHVIQNKRNETHTVGDRLHADSLVQHQIVENTMKIIRAVSPEIITSEATAKRTESWASSGPGNFKSTYKICFKGEALPNWKTAVM